MITLSYFPSRTLAALALAAGLAGATSAQAVTAPVESTQTVTIYKQLGFAFGFTNSTPSNLFGAFGGGGGGGGGGGFAGVGSVPPLNLGPAGGNFLVAPGGGGGGGGGGGMVSVPPPILKGGAPIVQGGDTPNPLQTPPVGQEAAVQVPDLGVGPLGFALVLAGMAAFARRFARVARRN